MITLRIIDTNQNSYFPQKVEGLSFEKIHYGGASNLDFKLNEDPSFQNHKVGLFNNIYLYNFSRLIWSGYITEFQRDYKNLNYNLKASGLLIDFKNKRIKKTYVLDDIGEFRNWSEKDNKQSDEILYGFSQATDEKGVKISLLQRSYNAEEDGLFELKIDENIERLKARIFINQPSNFTTKLVTLDENHSNPTEEKKWENAQKVDEDVLLNITKEATGAGTFTKKIYSNADAKATNEAPNTNFGSIPWVPVSKQWDPTGGYEHRGFFKFLTTSIPSNATILSAKFHFYPRSTAGTDTYHLKRVVATWTEMGITWINQPGVSDAINSLVCGAQQWYNVDITTAFKNWHNATWANYGFRMNGTNANRYQDICSKEYAESSKYPYVEVKYSTPEGDVEVNKRYLQLRVECTANETISTDKYFAQLENLKLLTADNEINAANILKDLLLNHTQKLDLDTSLIQDCFNYKDIELCESLDGWAVSDADKLTLSLEGSIVKEGQKSIKTIVVGGEEEQETIYPDKDSHIYKYYPNNNYGSATTLEVAHAYNYTHNRVAFLRFPTNAIPEGATITSAKFRFYIDNWFGVAETNDLKRVTSDWIENTIKWNLQPSIGSAFADFVSNATGWKEIDIIDEFSKWYSGEWANYGLCIVMRETVVNADFTIRSREYSGTSSDPYVLVSYTTPSGLGETLTKTLSPTQNLQNKNLFRLWVYSTITGDILKSKFGENLKYQYEPDWSCKYEADQEPPAADPIWTLTGTDYASVAGGILTINKTGANECSYKRLDIGHNVKGNLLITKMKVSNAAKTTFLQIADGIAKATLAIYTTKIEDWNDAANSYTIDMTKYRELWLTMKNNFWLLYIDGILALTGETQTTTDKWFKFGMDSSTNLGKSYWDYVYYYNLGYSRNKKIEKTINIDVANTWEETIIDLNNFPIETRNEMKYIQFKILTNDTFTFYIDWIRSNFELTSAYYRDRTAPLSIIEDGLAYQDYEWKINKDKKVEFFEVDRDEIDYVCPIKNLVFEENSVSYFSKIFLVYFDAMMKRQEIELADEDSKIPFDKEHVIGLGGISDVGAKAIGEAQFSFHQKPRYQLNCLVDNFVFDKNGGRINPIEIEPNNNIKFLGIANLPIFRIIKTDYANEVCRLTLETEEENLPNITRSIIEVL